MTLQPLTRMMFAHVCSLRSSFKNFNRGIKLSNHQFKKQADESIVKKNTLTLFEL